MRVFDVWLRVYTPRGVMVAALLLLAAMAPALPLVLPLSGEAAGGWVAFLGGFHPLLVHFPVVLVPVAWAFDLLSVRRARSLAVVVPLLLYLAAASALAAFSLGLLLAHGEGTAGSLVSRHYRAASGVVSAALIAALLRWLARHAADVLRSHRYLTGSRAALTLALVLTVWTGHLGAQLTHGERYLTDRLPWRAEEATREETRVEADSRVFETMVQPIFRQRCVSCHGDSRIESGLRLDSFTALMEGGEGGRVVHAGDAARSEIIRRVTLPRDHEEAMPAQGRPPPTAEQIAMLRWWIDAGASETLRLAEVTDPPAEVAAVLERMTASPLPIEEAQRLAEASGLSIVPVSGNPADGFRVTAFNLPGGADEALVTLAPIAALVTEADLSHTDATDAAVATLAAWTRLGTLNLSFTNIRGARLGELGALTELRTLNLTGTPVAADAAASQLAALTSLELLVLSGTPLPDAEIRRVAAALPNCTVVAGAEPAAE